MTARRARHGPYDDRMGRGTGHGSAAPTTGAHSAPAAGGAYDDEHRTEPGGAYDDEHRTEHGGAYDDEHAGAYEGVSGPRDPALAGLVASAVGYRSESRTATLHRGLPSPYLTLIFALDGPIVGGESPEQAGGADAYRFQVVLGGLRRSPAFVQQAGRESGIQLALHPLAARSLFGIPAGELAGLAADGTGILGDSAERLRQRLGEEPSWDARFAALNDHLRRSAEQFARRDGVRAEVAEGWRWLARHAGTGSMDGLASHVALSPRQLTALFRREVGMGPKQVSRLMRFQHARRLVSTAVQAGRAPDLARVAAQCGYYDHSHLVRDFRQYTGLSPTGWIAEERRNIQAMPRAYGEQWGT